MPSTPLNPLAAQVTEYTVTQFKSDVVPETKVVSVKTEFGMRIDIRFGPQPPAAWLVFANTQPVVTTVYLEAGEFDRTLHLLQSEDPVYVVCIDLLGLRAFSLSSGTEVPGEGPADPPALADFMARVRQTEVASS